MSQRIGIAAIAVHQPAWVLGNDWFGDAIGRKFVKQTGIESRAISRDDEVTMAVSATRTLQRQTGCDLRRCAAVVFVSPSFVPTAVARKHVDQERTDQERLSRAGRQFVRQLGIPACPVVAINWFCSGFSKAISIVHGQILPHVNLHRDQFVLVVAANRISRITDYACPQTAPLFGDMATATLLARPDSDRHPVHFEILYAGAEKKKADGAFFDFHLRRDVPVPTADGGRAVEPERLVFSLNGMGIADAAPRAMAGALAKALRAARLDPAEVRFVVPHQAGTGIVRLAEMKFEEIGIRGQVINGITAQIGNVSSCSIPYALWKMWPQLHGTIGCPTAAVGNPGEANVSQGCILLRATAVHGRLAQAA
jgi:3-oxoacyl-[acyl-carrier-protein] synthase III